MVRLARSPHAIGSLTGPNGATLSVGVATPGDRDNPDLDQPLATVEYSPASGDPPYLAIVGDPLLTFQTGGVVVFRFAGQWTEILRRNCVPVETMLLVAESFLATGELPQWIGWEEV